MNNLKLELLENKETMTDSWGLEESVIEKFKDTMMYHLKYNSGYSPRATKAILESLTDNEIGCLVNFLVVSAVVDSNPRKYFEEILRKLKGEE